MTSNGNGVYSNLGKAAIFGFCGLCIAGYFSLSTRLDANGADHQLLRSEEVRQVSDVTMSTSLLLKENSTAHSEICQRLSRIEALLK